MAKRARASGIIEPGLLHCVNDAEVMAQYLRWFDADREKDALRKLSNLTASPYMVRDVNFVLSAPAQAASADFQGLLRKGEFPNMYLAYYESGTALQCALLVHVSQPVCVVNHMLIFAQGVLHDIQNGGVNSRPHISNMLNQTLATLKRLHPTLKQVIFNIRHERIARLLQKCSVRNLVWAAGDTGRSVMVSYEDAVCMGDLRLIFGKAAITKKSQQWFANAKETLALEALRRAESSGSVPLAFAKEVDNVMSPLATSGVAEIRNIHFHDEIDTMPILAYKEIGNRNLQMGILYDFDRKRVELYVSRMAIACQGVLYDMQRNAARTRPSMDELFRYSLCEIRKIYPSLNELSIVIASPGSRQVVDHVLGPKIRHNKEQHFSMRDVCCMVCSEQPATLAFEQVGGEFCSSRCGRKMWDHLQWLEHPATTRRK